VGGQRRGARVAQIRRPESRQASGPERVLRPAGFLTCRLSLSVRLQRLNFPQETRLRRLTGARVGHVTIAGHIDDLFAVELVLVEAIASIVLQNLVVDASED